MLDDYKLSITKILNYLYDNEIDLFENKVCEICIMFRFAYQLQKYIEWFYFVDCEYNRAFKPNDTWKYFCSWLKEIT